MVKVELFAMADRQEGYVSRGAHEFAGVPAAGEIVEIFTSGDAVLVRVEDVIHTPDRTTHAAEIRGIVFARGTASGDHAMPLFESPKH